MKKTLSLLICILLLAVPFLSASAETVTVKETFTAPSDVVLGEYVQPGEYFTLKLDTDGPDQASVDSDGFRMYNVSSGSSITAADGVTIDEVRFTVTYCQGAIAATLLFSPGSPAEIAFTEVNEGSEIDIKDINADVFTVSASNAGSMLLVQTKEVTVIGHREVEPVPTPTPAPDPKNVPTTGDSTPVALCAAAMLISAGVFAVTVFRRKRGS